MKTVIFQTPSINPQGKKITLPQTCCVCTKAAAGFVSTKAVDQEGAAGRPVVEIPYCEEHLGTGQKFYERLSLDSNAIVPVRLIITGFITYATFILAPDLFPATANWNPVFLGFLCLVFGFVFTTFTGYAGGLSSFDALSKKLITRKNNIEIPKSMKDSHFALGFGGVAGSIVDEKLQITLEVLNDDYALLAERDYAIKAI